jgi:phenylacetate-CoA ligase
VVADDPSMHSSQNEQDITRSDIIQVAYGYGLFTGGLGLHYGAEKIGASVIPISGGNTRKQLQLMEDFGSTVIACTPSYAAYLGESIIKEGIDPKHIKLKAGVFGAEPWTEQMRVQIQELLGIKAYDIYGLTEIVGPGVSMECEHQCGNHIYEDHFISGWAIWNAWWPLRERPSRISHIPFARIRAF